MLSDNKKVQEILAKDGVVSIVTTGQEGAHLVATWNNFVQIVDDNTLAIPAGGYIKTEKNVKAGSKVQLIAGSKEVEGTKGLGTGFRLTADASFTTEGPAYQVINEKFPWARAAFELKVEDITFLM